MRTIGSLYKPDLTVTDVYQPTPDAARISRELRLSPYTRIGALADLGRRYVSRRHIAVKPVSGITKVTVRRVRSARLQRLLLPPTLKENVPAMALAAALLLFVVVLLRAPQSFQPAGQAFVPRPISPAATYAEIGTGPSSASSGHNGSSATPVAAASDSSAGTATTSAASAGTAAASSPAAPASSSDGSNSVSTPAAPVTAAPPSSSSVLTVVNDLTSSLPSVTVSTNQLLGAPPLSLTL